MKNLENSCFTRDFELTGWEYFPLHTTGIVPWSGPGCKQILSTRGSQPADASHVLQMNLSVQGLSPNKQGDGHQQIWNDHSPG
jgi:hypothetical protein